MSTQTIVSPENIFNTLWGFQRTAALKTGIDLDIFTASRRRGSHRRCDREKERRV